MVLPLLFSIGENELKIIIERSDTGKTIRSLLQNDLGFSSSILKKVKFSPGGITVNGEFRTVRYELTEGDVLNVKIEDVEEDVSPYIIPIDIPLEIIYSDDNYTVVNKPPHMPAHPSFGHRDDTVANALAFLNLGVPYVFRPVNRLDADTSGAMIVANSKLASYTLNKAMSEGKIHKTYIAVLESLLPQKEGVIDTYLRRVGDSIIKREVCDPSGGGKRAITKYKVICEKAGKTLVVVYPVTGRTHQIRVHFSSIGAPLSGDTLYGGENGLIGRQALHALKTSFFDPFSSENVEYIAKLPNDMKEIVCDVFGKEAMEIIDGII